MSVVELSRMLVEVYAVAMLVLVLLQRVEVLPGCKSSRRLPVRV